MDLKKKIGEATAWSSFAEIASKLVAPIVNLFLARLLSPEAFGAVATITMIISFAEIFADAGFQKYLVQHEFETERELDESTNVSFWLNLTISIFLTSAIILFRNQLAAAMGSPELGTSIAISSINILCFAFSSIQSARLKRAFDFKTLFISRVGAAVIPLIITVPLAFLLKNYWALVIGTLSSNIFVTIVLTVKSSWKPLFFFDFKLLKNILPFCTWTLLESLSIWLTSSIGVFIVGRYLNSYYLGMYKTSMSTVNSYMGLVSAAVAPVLFSALSRYQNSDENFKSTYYSFQRLSALLLFPMGVGAFVFRDFVTQILLGDQWKEASGFIGLWALTSAVSNVLSNYNSEVLRSKGRPKVSLVLQLQHLLFLVPVLILGANHSFEMLYVLRSLIRLELIIAGVFVIKVMFGFSITMMIKNLFPAIFSSLIMGLIGYLLQKILVSLWWQLICVCVCIICYFFILFTVFPKTRKEFLQLPFVKKILTKKSRP